MGTQAPTDSADTYAANYLEELGFGRGHLPQLHVAYETMAKELLERAQPIAELKKSNASQPSEIDAWLAQRSYQEQSAKFQPIRISASEFVVIIDAKTAAVVGIALFKGGTAVKAKQAH